MNYVTETTVVRNSGIKFINMTLLDFQIFFCKKKNSTSFGF